MKIDDFPCLHWEMQIQPIRLKDIDHAIEIDQSQSENFQNKKFAKKSADHGISCNLIGRICVPH